MDNHAKQAVRRRGGRFARTIAVALLWLPVAAAGQASLPEAGHFDATRFLTGLRQQGLFDLQAAYMQAYPPASEAEKAWYQRERLLAQALRPDTTPDRRLQLLKESDAAAQAAIAAESDSPRSVLWRADRVQVWLYLGSKPLFDQVLFYGATPSIRKNLREFADQAVLSSADAVAGIETYLERLAGPTGEALQREGDKVGLSAFALSRQLQFDQCWAQLHKAAGMEHGDIDQGLLAGQIIRSLQEQRLLQEDAPGGLRAQALFMAAVAGRLQGDYPSAQDYLKQAVTALPSRAAGMDWIPFAVEIERVRLSIDQRQFAAAVARLEQLAPQVESADLEANVKFARRLSIAMLQFEALTLAADAAVAEGKQAQAAGLAAQRFDGLAKLAADAPDHRMSLYQMVGERMSEVASVGSLPPFGKAVFAARWLGQKRYVQALAAAEELERETAGKRDFLAQDAMYLKAVCLQSQDQSLPAAEAYARFAREAPQDKRAQPALRMAMQLLVRQREALGTSSGRALLLEVGEPLLRADPELAKQRKWVLPLAEAALEEGHYLRAAELFQMVPRDDGRQYSTAMVGRILAISGQLRFGNQDQAATREQAAALVSEAVALAESLGKTDSAAGTQPIGDADLAARVLLAAAQLTNDALNDPDRALQLLAGAEQRWKDDPALLAQLLNVRIQVLQRKGDPAAVGRSVEEFIAANPQAAGPLIVSLLSQMQREVEQQQKLGRQAETEKSAALAVGLAEQLDKWASEHPDALKPEQRYAIRYRLARSLLQAGHAERALAQFDKLAEDSAKQQGGQTRDAGVLEGRADALFALQRWADARDAYLDIWRRAAIRSELWWRALLRSLQCSTRIDGSDPDEILRVIRQHQYLYPDMGGPALSKQFDEMSFEMLKRSEAKKAGTKK